MSMIGKSLAHYEVTAEIGRGGMGEVYQAKDTKLGRNVAIKVLPEEFARDADRQARFQREAKLLASLNHPNIAAIYGLEESDGTNFLVLELIEGDTLANWIKTSSIPVEESLKLALQIAEALEAAHEKGVIHRDLKPANIKITPEGKIKVLDFGLAKAYAGDPADLNLSNSPTLSDAATQAGVILGTAAYMPPEQARGNPVDKRADIWAFGCVLYEMLSGKQTWTGNTVTDIIAAVVAKDPDFSFLPANLHPSIQKLLNRCLQKDPAERFRDVGDVRFEIKQVLTDPSGVFAQPVATVEPQKKLRTMLPWIAVTAILCLIIAGVAGWLLKPAPPPEPRPVTISAYDLPEGQELDIQSPITVSRDGTKIAFVTNVIRGGGLYLKNTDELNARPIQLPDDFPVNPFFSFDGQWIGYFSLRDRQLKKIAITSSMPEKICDVNIISISIGASASWGADDMIVFAAPLGGSIMQVSAKGGNPEVIVKAEENERFSSPQMLPNGNSILFTTSTGNFPQESIFQVAVQSLESGKRKNLFPGISAQYLSTGHLVYVLDNKLFAVPFDPDRLETTGDSVPVLEGVSQLQLPISSITQSAISDTGILVYVPGTAQPESFPLPKYNLVWVNRQGKMEEIPVDSNIYDDPKISPDGTKVAVAVETEEGSSDIYILDLDNETPMPLTLNENSTDPLWTPDGKRIVFLAGDGDKRGIYRRAADLKGKEELIALTSDAGGPPWSWADDGKTLVTTKNPFRQGGFMGRGSPSPERMMRMMGGGRGGGGGTRPKLSPVPKRASGSEGSASNEEMDVGMEIGTLSMEGEHEWQQLLHLDGWVNALQVSPDHRWIAYNLSESDQQELYVSPFPDVESGGPWQVLTGGAIGCLWSQNGRELIYASVEDLSLMAVGVETEPTVNFGKPKVIFNPAEIGLYRAAERTGNYDVSLPDGNRFLMLKEVETAEDVSQAEESTASKPNRIIIVTNWFEELKEKVPVE